MTYFPLGDGFAMERSLMTWSLSENINGFCCQHQFKFLSLDSLQSPPWGLNDSQWSPFAASKGAKQTLFVVSPSGRMIIGWDDNVVRRWDLDLLQCKTSADTKSGFRAGQHVVYISRTSGNKMYGVVHQVLDSGAVILDPEIKETALNPGFAVLPEELHRLSLNPNFANEELTFDMDSAVTAPQSNTVFGEIQRTTLSVVKGAEEALLRSSIRENDPSELLAAEGLPDTTTVESLDTEPLNEDIQELVGCVYASNTDFSPADIASNLSDMGYEVTPFQVSLAHLLDGLKLREIGKSPTWNHSGRKLPRRAACFSIQLPSFS